jgi:hypothetical protein
MATAAAIITRPTFTLADRLKIQRQRSRAGDFIVLGTMMTIVFEASKGVRGPAAAVTNRMGLNLDWMSHGPRIALSTDHYDLLLPDPLPPLPKMRDPNWIPTPRYAPEDSPQRGTGLPPIMDGPMVEQSFFERANGRINDADGRLFLVFCPVAQIALMPRSQACFHIIAASFDPADRTDMALLINPDSKRAYFVGGRFTLPPRTAARQNAGGLKAG